MQYANENKLKSRPKKTYKSPIMTEHGTVGNKTMTGGGPAGASS
jgi:hypothetical protein